MPSSRIIVADNRKPPRTRSRSKSSKHGGVVHERTVILPRLGDWSSEDEEDRRRHKRSKRSRHESRRSHHKRDMEKMVVATHRDRSAHRSHGNRHHTRNREQSRAHTHSTSHSRSHKHLRQAEEDSEEDVGLLDFPKKALKQYKKGLSENPLIQALQHPRKTALFLLNNPP